MHLLGSFEQAVLLAVLRLRANAFGRAILDDIRQKLGDGVTSGAVCVTLDRLEAAKRLLPRHAQVTALRSNVSVHRHRRCTTRCK